MKLRNKFLIIFLIISVLPVLITSLYTYSRYRQLADTQTSQVSDNILKICTSHTEESLDVLEHILEALYLPGENHNSIIDNIQRYRNTNHITDSKDIFQSNEKVRISLQNYYYNNNDLNGIFLFLPNGTVLGRGYGNGINVKPEYDPLDNDWYKKTLSLHGGTYLYGPCKKDFFDGKPSESISFCTALYDIYDKGFLGILMVDCNPHFLSLEEINPMPLIARLVIYNNDQIVSSTDSSVIKNGNVLEYEQKLTLDPLVLKVFINQEELYRQFGIIKITLVAVILTSIIVAILISMILANSLTKPITTLSDLMLQPEETADVSVVPYFNLNNEIGILYASYQKMLDDKNLYVKNELENKLILLDSQMRSLESQINAHFLYNTLESINSIATLERIPAISTMSMALGRMFRYSIKTESELVPLREELRHTADYSIIQEIRFNHQYTLKIAVPEICKDIVVLKLILQPLVENALYHGLNYCKNGDKIQVTARIEKSDMILAVEDNGIGLSPEKIFQLKSLLNKEPKFSELGQRCAQSIGIKNIHTRIQLYYGKNYGLFLDEQPEKGAKISIRVPILQ